MIIIFYNVIHTSFSIYAIPINTIEFAKIFFCKTISPYFCPAIWIIYIADTMKTYVHSRVGSYCVFICFRPFSFRLGYRYPSEADHLGVGPEDRGIRRFL